MSDTAKEQVEAYWNSAQLERNGNFWWVRLSCFRPTISLQVTVEEAWSAAYAFTLDHKRKDAELVREIVVQISHLAHLKSIGIWHETISDVERTIERLQKALTELRCGVRKDAS